MSTAVPFNFLRVAQQQPTPSANSSSSSLLQNGKKKDQQTGVFQFVKSVYDSKFLEQRKLYQQAHESSGKDLAEYFELRQLLPSGGAAASAAATARQQQQSMTILKKLEEQHSKILRQLETMRKIVLSMRQMLHDCKEMHFSAQQSQDQQQQHLSNQMAFDMIEMMEFHLKMLDADMDMKELIFCSLHEAVASTSSSTSGSDSQPSSADSLQNSILTSSWQRQIMIDQERLHERITAQEARLEQLQDRGFR